VNHLRSAASGEITGLLKAWSSGRADALEELMGLVYNELRKIARSYMRRQGRGQTLQATALINEAYLRMVEAQAPDFKDRAHFYAVAAQMIRRILVDATRARCAAKRQGDRVRVTFSDQLPVCADEDADLLALDDALSALAKWDARKARVVELRYFGGLSVAETAEVLKISPQSVLRDWKLSKVWLARELSRSDRNDS
jgi:RNA polymerase sigma factor (TIGR02999 family)